MTGLSAALSVTVTLPTLAPAVAVIRLTRYPSVPECVANGPRGPCVHRECRYHLAHRGYWEHEVVPTRDSQQWLETRKIGEAYSRAVGSERPLSEMARDSGLRAIVVLLAAEYSVPDLEWIAGNVPKQAWWRSGDRVRGLGSLTIEVVSRALGERDGPPRTTSRARSHGVHGEDSRIHRNTLLENAETGRYGAEIRRAARSGVNLKQLADELERREATGELQPIPLPVTSTLAHGVGRSRGVVRAQGAAPAATNVTHTGTSMKR